ncbi:TetR/AcrR family transcriptional regulator [Cytobacillus purgationiresistens]|uniref:AcrR family transcriptional regulator n=1 Tax=Cytobacillus purgationiresistens TaxID=863449 RepID=A0ABU0APS1_9BACI|nr:TetR/AcrR family transcriptional regulator [Cytobacillus purgationiresistens]MDQ0272751.1 AcrR family transcriptional regulator [Cytobacillus purgationiresistens]
MRKSKEAQERRNEILDVAEALFNEQGYDGTSTHDILKKIGIARGTLYYHFESKEAIMDGIIDRYNKKVIEGAQAIAEKKEVSVIERLLLSITSLNVSGAVSEELMTHIHKPQNALMHQKIQRVLFKEITPIFTIIIQNGIEENLFHTDYPFETVEMLLVYASTIFDDGTIELTREEQSRRMIAFAYNAERLLGTEQGVISQQLMKTLAQE